MRKNLFVFQRFNSFLKIRLGDFFLGDLSQFEHIVDNFVFKQWRAQLLLHLLVLLNELKELTFLTRVLTCLVHDRLGHFRVGHFDLCFLAQFCQQQAQTHTAFCQFVVLISRLDLVVIVAFNLWVFLVPQLVRDLTRFCFD